MPRVSNYQAAVWNAYGRDRDDLLHPRLRKRRSYRNQVLHGINANLQHPRDWGGVFKDGTWHKSLHSTIYAVHHRVVERVEKYPPPAPVQGLTVHQTLQRVYLTLRNFQADKFENPARWRDWNNMDMKQLAYITVTGKSYAEFHRL